MFSSNDGVNDAAKMQPHQEQLDAINEAIQIDN